MNLVAHQLLSFNQTDLMVGNLLGEVVRAKDYENYSAGLAKGILLHRTIDSFTDTHKSVKNSTNLLHQSQGKYAPVVVDIMYDYLLIKNWEKFSDVDFPKFKTNCYQVFSSFLEDFPSELKHIVKYLISEDWFEKYATLEGVSFTLKNMGNGRKYENNLMNASKELYFYENEFEHDFLVFFPELLTHCLSFIKN